MASPGCVEKHSVEIFDRGGERRIAELQDISAVKWGRVRDDTSEASFSISARNCSRQAEIINGIEPGRHEAVIYRDGIRSYEGPISLRGDGSGGVDFDVKDVSWYLGGLIMRSGYDNSYPNIVTVTERLMTVLTTELTRKDTAEFAVNPDLPSINVLPFLTPHAMDGEAKTAMVTVPYQYYVLDHLKNCAQNNGIDFVVVGRAIHIWDTSFGLGQTPVATQADFLGDLIVSSYGAELATYSAATDGQGNFGDAGGVDPYYGLRERLATAYDETTDATVPTVAELVSQAERNLAGRNPTPVQVRVPDNSTINPNGVLHLDLLVPGVYIPLRADIGIRTLSQMQKLKSMSVTETPDGESISVTLYPASGPDLVDDGDD